MKGVKQAKGNRSNFLTVEEGEELKSSLRRSALHGQFLRPSQKEERLSSALFTPFMLHGVHLRRSMQRHSE
jgi:hypothetical protein